jgi:hypothetical protein
MRAGHEPPTRSGPTMMVCLTTRAHDKFMPVPLYCLFSLRSLSGRFASEGPGEISI